MSNKDKWLGEIEISFARQTPWIPRIARGYPMTSTGDTVSVGMLGDYFLSFLRSSLLSDPNDGWMDGSEMSDMWATIYVYYHHQLPFATKQSKDWWLLPSCIVLMRHQRMPGVSGYFWARGGVKATEHRIHSFMISSRPYSALPQSAPRRTNSFIGSRKTRKSKIDICPRGACYIRPEPSEGKRRERESARAIYVLGYFDES